MIFILLVVLYNLDRENICVLFYRGNDKRLETNPLPYDEVILRANSILKLNQNIKFLIQSEETEFIDLMARTFTNNIIFHDEIRYMNKCVGTVDRLAKTFTNNFKYSYLANTIIMSKCKYIICMSGNCSLWVILYRKNASGVYQYLSPKEYILC